MIRRSPKRTPQHREALAQAAEQRHIISEQQTAHVIELINQNTRLTELVKEMSQRIESLTVDVHRMVTQKGAD